MAAAAVSTDSKEKKTAKGLWLGTLKKAMEYDSWGQSLESIEEYERLIKLMEAHQREIPSLSIDEKTILQLTVACMKLRIVNLSDLHGKAGLKAADIKLIPPVLDVLFTGKPIPAFPIQLSDMPQITAVTDDGPADAKHASASATAAAPAASGSAAGAKASTAAGGTQKDETDVLTSDADGKVEAGGTLIAKPAYRPGSTSMSIFLDRWGLKDAETYFEPHVTVSVVNEAGKVVGESQDTPNSKRKKTQHVLFGHWIHIAPTWDELCTQKLTIFFEFKHFKFQKKKVSTRCFAFVETKEIKSPEQTLNLELYKKPTDFTKKKLALFTIKQLYCTINVQLQKH